MDFDETVVSVGKLLDLFWESHDPFHVGWGAQYAHKVWYANEEDKRDIDASIERLLKAHPGKEVHTTVAPCCLWTNAEDYHQKYYLRSRPQLIALLGLKNDKDALRDSPYAARLNAWVAGVVAGRGGPDDMAQEVQSWDLPKSKRDEILSILGGNAAGKKKKIFCGASK